ncbi:MAG: hypothetical protein KGM98_01910, partial [Bacteroidota bacterium]|nr:hypothetical protein [Bacteroidota bacterium]
VASSVIVTSCKKEFAKEGSSAFVKNPLAQSNDNSIQINTFKGPEIQVGEGKVRSFISISHSGVPQEIGFEMTDSVMFGLPATGENSYIIPLHQKAGTVTPFDHMELDWNPQGHPPAGIYTVPHFDFHFYKISLAAQMAIPAEDPTTAKYFNNYPPAGYIPSGYVPGPVGVAQMGLHWLDVTSPEFHGGTFTKTFIYGSYDGAVTFYEPMVTKDFLNSTTSSSANFRQPLYFDPTGTYYPTRYNVYRDQTTGNYYVSLGGFVWR